MRHLFFCFLLVLYYDTALSASLKVVATIKPIHSLVLSVTDGVLKPDLLDYQTTCLHDYTLKPSNVSKMESSNVIFYIDDNLETFVKTFAKDKTLVKLSEAVDLLPTRPLSFSRDTPAVKDLHIWLSPGNAKLIINYISQRLSNIDKENSAKYYYNAEKAINRIDQEVERIAKELKNFTDKKYIVTHDAYQYFEKYFGLSNPRVILSIEEDSYMSVKSLIKLKKIMQEESIKCVFSHSLDNPKILSNDLNTKIIILDPVGSHLKPGKDEYLNVISNIAQNFKSCFNDP